MKIKKNIGWGKGVGKVGLGGQGGCDRRIEVFVKIQFFLGGVGVGGGWGEVSGMMGQDGCERRIEVFVKIKKKKKLGGGGWSEGGGVSGSSGQGGCKYRIEVFVKIKKKNIFFWGGGPGGGGGSFFFFFFFFFFGGGGGVRMDVNEELKFL